MNKMYTFQSLRELAFLAYWLVNEKPIKLQH